MFTNANKQRIVTAYQKVMLKHFQRSGYWFSYFSVHSGEIRFRITIPAMTKMPMPVRCDCRGRFFLSSLISKKQTTV